MTSATISSPRLEPEPLPANLTSVQPGGGVCYQIELAWGRWRRFYLTRFRPGYVRRMAASAVGSFDGCPHPVLDPRDLKFCRNQCTGEWPPADDPFRWREAIPFARWGLAELLLMSGGLALVAGALAWVAWFLAIPVLIILGLVVWFFRDPPRRLPTDPAAVLSPADGRITEITPLPHDPYLNGPAVKIGIFLSIFNVHVNRAPRQARVIRLSYSPGKFISAVDPHSLLVNENLWIGWEEVAAPFRRFIVRQVAGQFARRIVCSLRSGEVCSAGARFGMIKLGSRTELILPADPELQVLAQVGQKVRGGSSILARYAEPGAIVGEL